MDMTSDGLLDLGCISCADIPQMSQISVLAQIPQFGLIGVSEILASITSLEFFYSQAPTTMRSVTQSFNLLTSSLGSLLIVPLVYAVNSNVDNEWLPSNFDEGHVTWYFLILAAIMVLDMFYLWFMGRGYEYKTTAELTFNEENDDDILPTHSKSSSRDEDSLLTKGQLRSDLSKPLILGANDQQQD